MQMGRCCMCDPPPTLPGAIVRFIYPSFPADYEGIGDTAWQFGTTGNSTANSNVAYVELYTPSQRLTSATIVMEPVRFSVYSPASDGGTFDYWNASGISGFTQLRQYLYEDSANLTCPISPTLIPSGSHAEFTDGELHVSPGQAGLMPTRALSAEPNLFAGNNPVGGVSLVAFAHRINGSIVGSVKTPPFTVSDSRCVYTYGDIYELDIWWQRIYTPNSSSPDTPMTMRNFYPLSRVSNSSKKPPELLRTGASTIYAIGFANVNFTPAFSALTHTYSISISGHSGWTLLSGSNGPIPIQDYSGIWSGGVSQASATLEGLASQPIQRIVISWNAEIVYVTVTRQTKLYYYRSTTTSATYRSETTSTDHGGVNHAAYGLFNASGTTVFEYIDWNIGVSLGINVTSFPDGVYSNAALPTKPADLPQTITLTRIPRPTTGSTTYDSGAGNFTVPAGKTIITAELWGAGAGGGAGGAAGGDNGASGGGGGAYCKKTLSVSPGDLIAYSVGAGGSGGTVSGTATGSNGGDTTVASGTYTAGGGIGGLDGEQDNTAATAGGTASGGDINTSGGTSTPPVGDDGGAGGAAGGGGGSGGAGGVQSVSAAQSGTAPGGGGGGGAQTEEPGAAGANGRVTFTY